MIQFDNEEEIKARIKWISENIETVRAFKMMADHKVKIDPRSIICISDESRKRIDM